MAVKVFPLPVAIWTRARGRFSRNERSRLVTAVTWAGQRSLEAGGDGVRKTLAVATGLGLDAGEGFALGLGLDDADGLAVDEEEVVSVAEAALEGELAEGDAAGGEEVGGCGVLDVPAGGGEGLI